MRILTKATAVVAPLLLCCCGGHSDPHPVEVRPAARAAPDAQPAPRDVARIPGAAEEKLPARPRPSRNSRGRVLFLGDSFSVGAFGRAFDQSLRDAGFEVFTSVAGGGSPYYWLSEYPPVSINITYWERTPTSQRRQPSISAVPKVESLMAKWRPDIVVVQTGTNLYASLRSQRRSNEANIREVESLVAKMGRAITSRGAKCYWISPPAASTATYPQSLQDEMLRVTRRAMRPYGKVFDSYAVTSAPPGSDGIHLGPAEARAWAQLAAADFLRSY